MVVWLLIGASAGLGANAADDSTERFTGVWQARFHGTVFCTLKMKNAETLSGAFYGCSINVNQDGDLLEPDGAGRREEACPMSNLRLRDGTLLFEMKDGPGAMKFELVLTGNGEAELRVLEAPVKIKPIRFEKQV
jgi:hypothetical protein